VDKTTAPIHVVRLATYAIDDDNPSADNERRRKRLGPISDAWPGVHTMTEAARTVQAFAASSRPKKQRT
jgi:hypothetical protein